MIVTETGLGFPKRRGKVRDVYDLGDKILLVATDRVSAFDVVFKEGIPNKGKALTGISNYWFRRMGGIAKNANIAEWPEELKTPELEGRAVLQKKAEVLPLEFIVRGYLVGSAWRSYKKDGKVHGVELPAGLKENQRLDEPMFTPSTKAEVGHDENISIAQAREISGYTDEAMEKSLRIYDEAYRHAEGKGIIICDTKFEFGLVDGELVLIDELLTPDSSRFWYKESYEAGEPKSMDKEYLREYLMGLDWDRSPPPPALPDEVVNELSKRYTEIHEAITGEKIV
ncbi:MAG: phosphoribosylaminoimidazolesuccinocarboxamide synthase [Candidatus Diapherotrites archaeon]|nr:phosphoribosylaminoimidazolesuccinocarboxamide synthase [Candidatus Diapherotrites archaeon]